MSRLKGKVALITGASRGIAAAVARGMADQGRADARAILALLFRVFKSGPHVHQPVLR